MSSINDPEQLTGSSRIYSNAKPGIIMEAFSMAGVSNLVFIINELDKAASGKGNGNPADVLLTLLDNLAHQKSSFSFCFFYREAISQRSDHRDRISGFQSGKLFGSGLRSRDTIHQTKSAVFPVDLTKTDWTRK